MHQQNDIADNHSPVSLIQHATLSQLLFLGAAIAAVILSAPVTALFLYGQLDGLSLWALMLPPWLGLPFIIAKPQGVFLTALRRLNIKSVGMMLGIFGLSVLIWGVWWQAIINHQPDQTVNLSLFPYSVPFGIALLYFGWKRNSDSLLILGSLCFKPVFYDNIHPSRRCRWR